MLKIIVPATELFDSRTNEFIQVKSQELALEHSLVSISKWESKWKKPFLSNNKRDEKTNEEFIDYIRCMTLTQNVNPLAYLCLTAQNMKDISDYISDNKTATWFNNANAKPNREIVTSEVIYCWMTQLSIPFECQKWHLSRLMALIRVCNEKNQPPKKMSRNDSANRQKALNAVRRKKHHTTG